MSTAAYTGAGALAAALTEWRSVLGDDAVDTSHATLERCARTTQDTAPAPGCVLYPKSTADVQAVARTASKHGVVIYPLSRGKNWGYGDACAPVERAAIVDLSRMDRILEVNTELAYAVIEPGVSQQQLYEHLRDNDTGLWLDCTGAGLDSSLVGNTLDRGFGHTRYGDHFLTACGLEVVLADGRVLNTGFTHFPQAKAGRVFRYGAGPFLDGLFCQSNLGIVTKLGLWLMPKPEAFTFFFIRVDKHEDLAPLVDRLRPLRMAGIIQSALHIGNDLRLISGARRYPWEATGGQTPLPDNVRAALRKEAGLGAWNAGGSFAGTKGQVRAARKALKRAVGGLGRLRFVDDRTLTLAAWAAGALGAFGLGKGLARKLATLKPNYGLLKGIPTDEPLLGAQWRLRNPPDKGADPAEAGCGLFWVSPVLPMTGEAAREVMNIVEPIFARHGFEALATFTFINERAMIGILNVSFDKADAEETRRATACYDALFDALMASGYVPYRTGLRGMPKLRRAGDTFWDVAAALKKALDPADIIARGRYVPPLHNEDKPPHSG